MRQIFKKGQIWDCYEFARNMKGKHNPNLIMEREDWEIFRDDFRGKLGEVAVKNYFDENVDISTKVGEIDFSISERGQWDQFDLKVEDKVLSIKSVKGKSKFLMIETSRFDKFGNYTYDNENNEKINIDYYVLVRVDINPEIDKNDLDYHNIIEFWKSKNGRKVNVEILGILSHGEFWNIKHIAPKGMRCNIKNLNLACNEENVDMSPGRYKTENLQKDNYIINSELEMFDIEHYFTTKNK